MLFHLALAWLGFLLGLFLPLKSGIDSLTQTTGPGEDSITCNHGGILSLSRDGIIHIDDSKCCM